MIFHDKMLPTSLNNQRQGQLVMIGKRTIFKYITTIFTITYLLIILSTLSIVHFLDVKDVTYKGVSKDVFKKGF